jgi:hypothetical protein
MRTCNAGLTALFILLAVLLHSACQNLPTALVPALPPSTVAVLNDFLAAINAGDVDAALALVADEATLVIPSLLSRRPETLTGQAAIHAYLESLVADHTQIGIIVHLPEGDKVTSELEYSNVFIVKELDTAVLKITSETVSQDGKITTFTFSYSQEAVEKLQAALAPVQPAATRVISVEALSGIWQPIAYPFSDFYFQFREDGSYRVADDVGGLAAGPFEVGQYRLGGIVLTLLTSDESLVCPRKRGKFGVGLTEAGELQFILREDECASRGDAMTLRRWRRVFP